MGQIPLDFGKKNNYSKDNFVVSFSNKCAYEWVCKWPNWMAHSLYLFGPEKCGKTHLAHIWASKTEAAFIDPENIKVKDLDGGKSYIIENVSLVKKEKGLFHLYNHIKENNGYLLITDREPASHLKFKLADLMSRLNAMPSFEIFDPDDVLLRMVLMKNFSDRQLRVGIDVIEFLALRMERSFISVDALVDKIDTAALKEKRNITIPFIKELLNI